MFQINRIILVALLLIPQIGHSLVGSKRAGKGWEAIVYIEFYDASKAILNNCSGFLINESQVITVGHCAIQDETGIKAKSASVCIGAQLPFANAGEGCFHTRRIRFAKNYKYNTPGDMVLLDLVEVIPLNFLGIKPIQLLTGNEANRYLKQAKKIATSRLRIVSFGSRNFNTPTLGKKGRVDVARLQWDRIKGIWQAVVKGGVYGQSDDGAGLLIKTAAGWKLAGLMLNASPDFFVSVQPIFDPCLPPEPAPRQPDIKISSVFEFVSINSLSCSNRFFPKRVFNKKFCQHRPLSPKQLQLESEKLDTGGIMAFERFRGTDKPSQKLKWLNRAAKRGHAVAMLQMSENYFNGDQLRKNSAKAIKLLEDAVIKTNPEAQYRIALLKKLAGSKPNTKLKGRWYKWMAKAANQGHAAAQYEYAQYLSAHNSNQVYDWLMRSARQGYAAAQYRLGYNFYHGVGVKKDRYIGLEWISFAAGQANLEANKFLQQHPQNEIIEY